MSAADLDALDRGVIEAGQLAAEALSRIAALEATVARLEKWVRDCITAKQILMRAGMPEPLREVAERKAARPHHLKVIE